MSNDVLITPASRKIELKDSSGNVDAKIETDSSGNLLITNAGGDISIGDTTSDVFIGDGTNSVDIVFEQNGEIRGTSGVTLTLGDANTTLRTGTDLSLNSNDITNVANITTTDMSLSGTMTLTGLINFTPDTADILRFDGQSVLKRLTTNGGLRLGHDDCVLIAAGDTTAVMEANIGGAPEKVVVGAEGGLEVYAFPNNDTSWANRDYFIFNGSGITVNGTTIVNTSGQWIGSSSGLKGEPGAKGATGAATKGQKGEIGVGQKGATGAATKGQKGEIGVGQKGATGAATKGQKGEIGVGQKGATGEKGATGAKGQKGQKGDAGAKGATGAKGQKGEVGQKGATGSKGQKGQSHVTGSVSGVSNSGWTTAFTVVGSGLGSQVRATFVGTANNVVVNTMADIVVNHSLDILVETKSGFYTMLSIRIVSDNNEDFAVQLKTNHANSVTLAVEVFPLNNETITFTSTNPYSGSTYTHDGAASVKIGGTGGNNGDLRVGGDYYAGTTKVINANGTWAGSSSGLKGEPGSKGQKGDTGAKGQKGEIGQKGATGAKGQKGEAGAKGATGVKGQKGEIGVKGATGAKGQKGEIGQKGATGQKGQKGGDATNASSLTSGTVPTARLPEFIEERFIYSSNDSNAVYMPMVKGGIYGTSQSSVTGAIKIQVPNTMDKDNNMMNFWVDIYEYSTGETMTFRISGYTYANQTWHNVSAINLSDNSDRDFTVRFYGNETTDTAYVAIGETNSTWTYPQVIVRDFFGGYDTSEAESQGTWDVSFVTSFDGTLRHTKNNNFPARDKGDTGAKGEPGAKGNTGAKGAPGAKGQKGEIGVKGATGQKGQKGEIGVGQKGATGAKGQKGESVTGQKGDTGAATKGQKGEVGQKGAGGLTTTDASRMDREDNRTISPSELSAGHLKFGFTSWTNNNSAPWADFLHMRSYTDSSGGSDNLLMFKKTSGMGVRLWQQTWGSSTAYSNYIDLIDTGSTAQTKNGDLKIGSAGINARLTLQKADNNISDHLNFYLGSTKMGEIGSQDTTWLRINQVTSKNIYTPRMFRADGGLQTKAGSATAPAISYYNDTNTGIFFPGGDVFKITTGGVNAVTVNSTDIQLIRDSVSVKDYLRHYGDTDTYFRFTTDRIRMVAGNVTFMDATEGSTADYLRFPTRYVTIGSNTAPQATFTIDQGCTETPANGCGTGNDAHIKLENTNTTGSASTCIIFNAKDSGGNMRHGAGIQFKKAIAWSANGQYPGELYFWTRPTSGNQAAAQKLDKDGNAIFKGNVTAYGSLSDRRLKENIENIPDATEKVQQLNGVTFNYKKDGKKATGLIAQELQEVLPEAVYTSENIETGEEHLAIHYGNVIGLLVESIKELKAEIEELKNGNH